MVSTIFCIDSVYQNMQTMLFIYIKYLCHRLIICVVGSFYLMTSSMMVRLNKQVSMPSGVHNCARNIAVDYDLYLC